MSHWQRSKFCSVILFLTLFSAQADSQTTKEPSKDPDAIYAVQLQKIRAELSTLLGVEQADLPFESASRADLMKTDPVDALHGFGSNTNLLLDDFRSFHLRDADPETAALFERAKLPLIRAKAADWLWRNRLLTKEHLQQVYVLFLRVAKKDPGSDAMMILVALINGVLYQGEEEHKKWLNDKQVTRYVELLKKLLAAGSLNESANRAALFGLGEASKAGFSPSYEFARKAADHWEGQAVAKAFPMLTAAVSLQEGEEGKAEREDYLGFLRKWMTKGSAGEYVRKEAMHAITHKRFDGHRNKAASLLPTLDAIARNKVDGARYFMEERKYAVRAISNFRQSEEALRLLGGILQMGEPRLLLSAMKGIASSKVAVRGQAPLATLEKAAFSLIPAEELPGIAKSEKPEQEARRAVTYLLKWWEAQDTTTGPSAMSHALSEKFREFVTQNPSDYRYDTMLKGLRFRRDLSESENALNQGQLLAVAQDSKAGIKARVQSLDIMRGHPGSMDDYLEQSQNILALPPDNREVRKAQQTLVRGLATIQGTEGLLKLRQSALAKTIAKEYAKALDSLGLSIEGEEGITKANLALKHRSDRETLAELIELLELAAQDVEMVEGRVLRKSIALLLAKELSEKAAASIFLALKMLCTEESMQLLVWASFYHPSATCKAAAQKALVSTLRTVAQGNRHVLDAFSIDDVDSKEWFFEWYKTALHPEGEAAVNEWQSPFGVNRLLDAVHDLSDTEDR